MNRSCAFVITVSVRCFVIASISSLEDAEHERSARAERGCPVSGRKKAAGVRISVSRSRYLPALFLPSSEFRGLEDDPKVYWMVAWVGGVEKFEQLTCEATPFVLYLTVQFLVSLPLKKCLISSMTFSE